MPLRFTHKVHLTNDTTVKQDHRHHKPHSIAIVRQPATESMTPLPASSDVCLDSWTLRDPQEDLEASTATISPYRGPIPSPAYFTCPDSHNEASVLAQLDAEKASNNDNMEDVELGPSNEEPDSEAQQRRKQHPTIEILRELVYLLCFALVFIGGYYLINSRCVTAVDWSRAECEAKGGHFEIVEIANGFFLGSYTLVCEGVDDAR